MRERDSFPEAFKDAVGIGVESFGTDFRRYLGWRGFVPPPPPEPDESSTIVN
jgi:hypothetical protein